MSATDRTEPVNEPAKLDPPLPLPELMSAYLRIIALGAGLTQ
ncbi:hypothetical protein [Mycolicibacterium komossense]|nr:hypothetical protein [Mycolicibacterium komossense]